MKDQELIICSMLNSFKKEKNLDYSSQEFNNKSELKLILKTHFFLKMRHE